MDRSQSVFSGAVQSIFVDIQRSLDSSRESLNIALAFAPRVWFDPLAEHVESLYPITTQNALQWLFRTYQTLESIVPFVHRIGEFHLAAFDTNSVANSISLGNIIPYSPCTCNAACTTRADLLNELPHQLGSPLDAQCLLIDIQTLDRILKCICPHIASLCRFEHNQTTVFCQYFEFQHQHACDVLTDRCFRRVKATLQALERSNGIASSVPISFLQPTKFDPMSLNFSSTRLLTLLNETDSTYCQSVLSSLDDFAFSKRTLNRVFWLRGPPGSGKSVACAHFLHRLTMQSQSTNSHACVGFTLSSKHCSPLEMLWSIVIQLNRYVSPERQVNLNQTIAKSMSLAEMTSQFMLPLLSAANGIEACTVVIDGLDSLSASDCDNMLTVIRQILSSISTIRFVLSSNDSSNMRSNPIFSSIDKFPVALAFQLGRDNQLDLNQFCVDILHRGFCKLATPLLKKRTKHFSNSTAVQGSQSTEQFLKLWHLLCGGSFSQCQSLCESFLRSSHVANVILRLALMSDLFLNRSLSKEQITMHVQSSFVFDSMLKIPPPVELADISSRNYVDFIVSRLPSDISGADLLRIFHFLSSHSSSSGVSIEALSAALTLNIQSLWSFLCRVSAVDMDQFSHFGMFSMVIPSATIAGTLNSLMYQVSVKTTPNVLFNIEGWLNLLKSVLKLQNFELSTMCSVCQSQQNATGSKKTVGNIITSNQPQSNSNVARIAHVLSQNLRVSSFDAVLPSFGSISQSLQYLIQILSDHDHSLNSTFVWLPCTLNYLKKLEQRVSMIASILLDNGIDSAPLDSIALALSNLCQYLFNEITLISTSDTTGLWFRMLYSDSIERRVFELLKELIQSEIEFVDKLDKFFENSQWKSDLPIFEFQSWTLSDVQLSNDLQQTFDCYSSIRECNQLISSASKDVPTSCFDPFGVQFENFTKLLFNTSMFWIQSTDPALISSCLSTLCQTKAVHACSAVVFVNCSVHNSIFQLIRCLSAQLALALPGVRSYFDSDDIPETLECLLARFASTVSPIAEIVSELVIKPLSFALELDEAGGVDETVMIFIDGIESLSNSERVELVPLLLQTFQSAALRRARLCFGCDPGVFNMPSDWVHVKTLVLNQDASCNAIQTIVEQKLLPRCLNYATTKSEQRDFIINQISSIFGTVEAFNVWLKQFFVNNSNFDSDFVLNCIPTNQNAFKHSLSQAYFSVFHHLWQLVHASADQFLKWSDLMQLLGVLATSQNAFPVSLIIQLSAQLSHQSYSESVILRTLNLCHALFRIHSPFNISSVDDVQLSIRRPDWFEFAFDKFCDDGVFVERDGLRCGVSIVSGSSDCHFKMSELCMKLLAPSFSFDLQHKDALSVISQFNLSALDLFSEQLTSKSTYVIQHALQHAIDCVQDCVSNRLYRPHLQAGTAMIHMLTLASSFAYFELRAQTCRRGAFALISELNTVESLCSSCLEAAETIDQDANYYSNSTPLQPLIHDLVASFRQLAAFVQETHQYWAGGDELLCRSTNIWLCAHIRPKTSFEFMQSVASLARWQTRPIPWLELISINMINSDDSEFMRQVLQINQSDTDQYSMLRVCSPNSHLSRHGCTSIHPSGRIMASTSFDRHVVLIWDALIGVCVQELVGHTALLSSVAFSSDGMLLCSGSQDGTARIWSTDSGECICVIEPRAGPITCVLLIDKPVNSTSILDSYLVATGGTDGCTRIFEPNSQRQFNMLLSHHSFQHQNGGVSAMILHPSDHKLLMIGYNEGAARLWYYHSSACRLLDGFDRVLSLSFTDDGSKALVYIENGQLCVWRVADAICEQVITLKSAKSVSIFTPPQQVTSPQKQRPKTPLRSPSKPLKSNLKTVTSPAAVLQALPAKITNSEQFRDSLAHWWACNLRF